VKVKHTFVNMDEGLKEIDELPEGNYVVYDSTLEVKYITKIDRTQEKEYTFKYRVRRFQ
jgi:hypothetical protein